MRTVDNYVSSGKSHRVELPLWSNVVKFSLV